MSRRTAWLFSGLVFLIALVVRVIAAAQVPFPIPEDTAYYHDVARNLVDGRGLVSDALWSYQTPPLAFPHPAFEVWLPLPSLLVAPFMALFGTGYRVAQVLPIVAGSAVAVLAWRLAADVAKERGLPVGRSRVLAVGAGLTAAVELPLVLHSTLADSTMLFAVLALAACVLMERIVREPSEARLRDWRLLALGLLLGLTALTRNEAAWLAVAWVAVAWLGARTPGHGRAERVRLIAIPGIVAFAVFLPWMVRDWLVFGSPLPGQAVANAFSVTGDDIFAWSDPPTLSRYLAQGIGWLASVRVEGGLHNLVDVLVVPSFPIGLIGLVALPWFGRGTVLRPLAIVSVVIFLVATLVFPVSTTWGTFLHAAGPVHVWLIISCLLALDAFIAWVGRHRDWTNPVAWLGPTLTIAASVLFTVPGIAGFGNQSRDVEERFALLAERLPAARISPASIGPVITDSPIWYAESIREPALALPAESAASVLDLARQFGVHYLVLFGSRGPWPELIDAGGPESGCFSRVQLPGYAPRPAGEASPDSQHVDVYEVTCP